MTNFLNAVLHQLQIISLPWWIAIGVITIALFVIRHKKTHIPGNILIAFLMIVLASTVFSRDSITDKTYSELLNLDLIGTWRERAEGHFSQRSELILNFFMILPIGFLFPLSFRKGFFPTLIFGSSYILLVETLQLLLKKGWFELSDIVDNTIGVIIGFGLYWLGKQIWEKIQDLRQDD